MRRIQALRRSCGRLLAGASVGIVALGAWTVPTERPPPATRVHGVVHAVVRGDVDGSGHVSAFDALAILSAVVERPVPRGFLVRPGGDGDCDGTLRATDALLALLHAVGRDTGEACVGGRYEIELRLSAPVDSFTALGETAALGASVSEPGGAEHVEARVRWRSLTPETLEVDSAGAAVARANGHGLALASIGSAVDTLHLVVRQVPHRLEVDRPSTSALIGDTLHLRATAFDRGDSPIADPPLRWHPADPDLAVVDSAGVVLALGSGRAIVEARLDTLIGVAHVEISANDSTQVGPVVDVTHAVSATIGSVGGTLVATAADGTALEFTVPPGALGDSIEITLTPLSALDGVPGSPALAGGASFAPEGLVFAKAATLRIVPAGGLPDHVAAFGARADGSGFALAPLRIVSGGWEIPVAHFSAVGALEVARCWQVGRGLSPGARGRQRIACILHEAGWPDWSELSDHARDGIVAALDDWFDRQIAMLLRSALDCAANVGGDACEVIHQSALANLLGWQAHAHLAGVPEDRIAGRSEWALGLIDQFFLWRLVHFDAACVASEDPREKKRWLTGDIAALLDRAQLLGRVLDVEFAEACGGAAHTLVSLVEIDPAAPSVQVGGTASVRARVRNLLNLDHPDPSVTWTVGDPSVAVGTPSGTDLTLEGVASGTTPLVATVQDVADTVTLTVDGIDVVIEPAEVVLTLGADTSLSVSMASGGEPVAPDSVVWSSRLPELVSVDDAGTVRALGIGPGNDGQGGVHVVAEVFAAGGGYEVSATVRPALAVPDAALEAAIRSSAEIDDPEAPLTWGALLPLENDTLTGHSRGITSLSGVEHLPKLRVASLGTNPITDLTPLAGQDRLEGLFLTRTDVSDLAPLAGLDRLEHLVLSYTDVEDLTPLAGLTSLVSLSVEGARVSDITPLAGLTALTRLGIVDNEVTDLTPLAGMTEMFHLRLSWNPITDFGPLAGMSRLYALDASHVDVSDLSPLSSLTNLTWLFMHGGSSGGRGALTSLAGLAGATALEWIRFSQHPLTDVSDLAALPRLRHVELWNNAISNLAPLVANEALTAGDTLTIYQNHLADGFWVSPEPETGPVSVSACGTDGVDGEALAALHARGVLVQLNRQRLMRCVDTDGDGTFDTPTSGSSLVSIYPELFPFIYKNDGR